MLEFLNSVRLYSCRVQTQSVSFDRSLVLDEDSAVNIALQSDISDNDENLPTKTKLNFSIITNAEGEDGSVVFEVKLGLEYQFHVMDVDCYKSMSNQDQLTLCSNLVYLDARRRLMAIFSSAGMTGLRIPLSLAKFQGDAAEP